MELQDRMVQKKKSAGKFSGWIGYTLSWTKRKFEDLNLGKEFFAKVRSPARHQHRPDPTDGNTMDPRQRPGNTPPKNLNTFPQRLYLLSGGNIVRDYGGERNNYRLPAYHRLDFSATLKNKPVPQIRSSWNFRCSMFTTGTIRTSFTDTKSENGTIEIQAKQISLFPIIPSVTWNFKF